MLSIKRYNISANKNINRGVENMALTGEQRQRMDKLDFQLGGGFSDFMTNKQKLEPADSKFLFIGLGGKGSSTVASIKTNIYKKFKCPEGKTHPKNFEYLVIDTDKNELDKLCTGGFGEVGLSASPIDLEACQLYDSSAAKKLKSGNHHLIPEYINEWLNPQIQAELQGNGASGIRQAGRYLLFGEDAFQKLRNALYNKLQSLHNQIVDSAKEELIVYIFAGVGGGTGSGTVIDIPYIVRKICGDNAWAVKVYGYIFLPDAYPVTAKGTHIKYNSYAALKEIDSLMNLGVMDGAAHYRATYMPGFEVDSVEHIFDSCVLVSGKRGNGLVKEPEKFTKRVVVDNIINLVSKNEIDNGFLANSFLDNGIEEIANKVKVLSDKTVPKNAYYQYLVIGTGALVLPIEQILAYIAHGTMDMFAQGWDRHAKQNHVEEMLHIAPMLPEEQANNIIGRSTVPLMQYTRGIGGKATKQDVISGSLFNILKQHHMKQNVALYNAWDIAKHQVLEFIIGQLEDYYNKRFTDPECGIYFLKELLDDKILDGRSINGVLYRLDKDYQEALKGLIAGQYSMQNQMDEQMRKIIAELNSSLCFGPIATGKIEDYRELCVSRLISDNIVYLYNEIISDCLKQIIAWIEEKITNLNTYIDIFVYMRDIVDRNYQSVLEGTIPIAEYAGQLLDFAERDDTNMRRIIKYMDDMLAEKQPEGLVSAFENEILKTQKRWVQSTEDFDPMNVFVHFLENQYSDLPNLTIERFLELKYGTAGLDKGLSSAFNELKNKAGVIFPTSAVLNLNSLASHRYVVVPSTALKISAAMQNFAVANGADVSKSVDMNSIYWYNLVIGVPLYALADINEYEKMYEGNNIPGMHTRENKTENWKDMPALSNSILWPSADFNKRERSYMQTVKVNVQKFIDCGLIIKEESTEIYRAICLPENDTSCNKESIICWCKTKYINDPEYTQEGLIDSSKEFMKKMISENMLKEYLVTLSNVYFNVTDENLYQLVRMNYFLYTKLMQMYEVYNSCLPIIEEANREVVEHKKMMKFYEYVRTGIISFEDDIVIMTDRSGEQQELMYFSDYTAIEVTNFIYYTFQNFVERFKDEDLEEMDEYAKELSSDHSEAAKNKYRGFSDAFMDRCATAREKLKKIDAQKTLKQAGMGNMIAKYNTFYDEMMLLKKG